MNRYYESTYIVMRTKEDADEFLQLAMAEGDATAQDHPFPPELSGQTTKLVLKMKKRQLVMWEDPVTEEQKFYRMHPAWKSHIVYDNMPDFLENDQ